MLRSLYALTAVVAALACDLEAGQAAAAPAVTAPAPIVFFDIAGPDLASQAGFYRSVFGWTVGPSGAVSVPVASPLPGNLRIEPGPVNERVLYLGVDDVTATLARIIAAGGSVVLPRMAVPGVVILALFKDPAGNRTGIVEMKDGKPVVPPAK